MPAIQKTFVIRNAGSSELGNLSLAVTGTHASSYVAGSLPSTTLAPGSSLSFTVSCVPQTAGSLSANLSITSNDADENPFDITLSAEAPPAAEIVVQHPTGIDLVDGTAALAFGDSNIGTAVTKTVTVRNTGNVNLTGLAVTLGGANAADFTVGTLGSTSLAPGSDTTFNITFTPTAAGSRAATLQIASNDVDENPFDISLGGMGLIPPAPEIVVQHPAGTNLADGTTALAFGDSIIGTPVIKTVTVRNTGAANLTGLALTLSGTNASDFAVEILRTTTLSPGDSTFFSVTFMPSAAGSRTAALQIASNDADEDPFDITLDGMGLVLPAPEIVVEEPAGAILVDGTAALAFGDSNIGRPVTKKVTIRNTGTASLTGLAVTRSGTNVSDFAVGTLIATVLAPGADTSFTVTFTPAAAGSRNGALQIASNDADESPFDIALTGIGLASPVPEIMVQQGKGPQKNLKDNKSKRDFGSIKVGKTSKAMVFTIKNDGTAKLKRLNLQVKGKQAKDFRIVKKPAKSVAPGKNTKFKVIYKPRKANASKVTMQITSNDKDENPFRVKLTGQGTR